jgi:hypothetical protein
MKKENYIYVMPEEFMEDKSVPAYWRLLGVLNGFFINNGSFWGSNKWLANRLGYKSIKTISTAVSKLEEMGKIRCERTKTTRVIFRNTPSNKLLSPSNQLPPVEQLVTIPDSNSLPPNSVSNSVNINNAKSETKVSPSPLPFSWKEYLQQMKDSPHRHINLIAFYFEERNISFDTKEKAQAAIRRHLRASREVSVFSDDETIKAVDKCKSDYPEIWTIETILKVLTR